MKTTTTLITAFLLLGSGFGSGVAAGADGSRPADLLEATGITGGVVVHLGCGDGRLTAALHASDSLLVRGLDVDAGRVAAARQHIDSLGLYGRVAAERYDGEHLPYGDNMINLIVIDDRAALSAAEVERVLVPGGKAVVASEGVLESNGLKKTGAFHGRSEYTKPWPADIDQWTHFLYDAAGNAVSKDRRIRYPRHTQWHAGPRFDRHHDAMASLSAMTSSGGRLYYIYDEGAVSAMHRPPHWKLIARDAFNGKLLWKRDIPTWMTHLYNFRAGPAQLPRRLVSVGDDVYVTLGWNAPVVKLEGATGETLLTYRGSEGAEEILLHGDVLLIAAGDNDRHIEASDEAIGYWDRAEPDVPLPEISIMAYDAASSRRLWRIEGERLGHLMPLSLCAAGDRVFYLDDKELHCLELTTGQERWASPFEPPDEGIFMRNYAPTVVAHQDVVLCLTWKSLAGYAIDTGQRLWQQAGAIGFASPADLFVLDGRAWTFPMLKGLQMPPKGNYIGGGKNGVAVDIRSGEIVEELPFQRTQHHHRCYRNKATENYFLLGHSGIQVADRKTKETRTHRWVRGSCSYGIMPANGYIYVPPDPCQCYFDGKINGFFALADANSWAEVDVESVLEKGPAYETIPAPSSGDARSSDWPTYRGDAARSGSAATSLPANPKKRWNVRVGAALTAPVVAAAKVYLADKEGCTVHCLDAESGKRQWKFFAAGPVDSPPTIAGGRCVFGCRDGSVYCLDARTGQLAWRFKTSKTERRIGWENRLASPLWVHGSVLVVDDTVYFAAGHSTNLDGGIRLYGLDLATGDKLHFTRLASAHWGNDGRWGYLSDVLTCSGEGTIGMRSLGFDKELKRRGRPGLQSSTALLDSTWFHRQQWRYGGNSGKLIVFDGDRTVTASNIYTGLKQRRAREKEKWNQWGHLHQKFTRYLEEDWFPVGTDLAASGRHRWSTHQDLQPRAMVMTPERLCLAGWIDGVAIELKTGRPKNLAEPDPHVAVLRLFAMEDGERLSEHPLPSDPVFDGLAVAGGRCYVACEGGRVLCFE